MGHCTNSCVASVKLLHQNPSAKGIAGSITGSAICRTQFQRGGTQAPDQLPGEIEYELAVQSSVFESHTFQCRSVERIEHAVGNDNGVGGSCLPLKHRH